MCEQSEEEKESHVAGMERGGVWRRALNGPEGMEGAKSCSVCQPR